MCYANRAAAYTTIKLLLRIIQLPDARVAEARRVARRDLTRIYSIEGIYFVKNKGAVCVMWMSYRNLCGNACGLIQDPARPSSHTQPHNREQDAQTGHCSAVLVGPCDAVLEGPAPRVARGVLRRMSTSARPIPDRSTCMAVLGGLHLHVVATQRFTGGSPTGLQRGP